MWSLSFCRKFPMTFVLFLASHNTQTSALPTKFSNNLTNLEIELNQNRVILKSENAPENAERLIVGFKLEGDSRSVIESDLTYTIKANTQIEIRLFGIDFQNISNFKIGFTNIRPHEAAAICYIRSHSVVPVNIVNKHTAVATINLLPEQNNLPYYLCYSNNSNTNASFFVYASEDGENWFKLFTESPLLPLWLELVLIGALLVMSGLFSGLNLGLMSLDKNELQVIERCGTEEEKYWARSISPVRKRGNYLLCTLLIGNVLVNSILTIFMDELTSGIFAVIISTFTIVIFGEIVPQALCSRHGLQVGAKTVYITYFFMGLTFPISYPISLILDKVLGEEIGNCYDRERLMEYIRVTKDYNHLEADEINIISGALKFKNIRVVDVMTPLEDVFMLPYDTTLNFDTLTLINKLGYSRIPIYENERNNVVGMLHVKDLSLIDTDHNLPLKAVLDFYSHALVAILEDVTLDVVLNKFKKGKSHIAMVRRLIDNGLTDPYYELLGIITLEDVIEELIQAEISDETDFISPNKPNQIHKEVQGKLHYIDSIRRGHTNITELEQKQHNEHLSISQQLSLAALQFLVSSVEPFRPDYLSEEVLKTLMARNIYFEAKGEVHKHSNIEDIAPENRLYVRGEAADYFVMILEGRARVIVTKENQQYDAGPFCYFGISALANIAQSLNPEENKLIDRKESIEEQSLDDGDSNVGLSHLKLTNSDSISTLAITQDAQFVPDFSLFCTEKTVYIKITRKLYTIAVQTTEIERKHTN